MTAPPLPRPPESMRPDRQEAMTPAGSGKFMDIEPSLRLCWSEISIFAAGSFSLASGNSRFNQSLSETGSSKSKSRTSTATGFGFGTVAASWQRSNSATGRS